MDEQEREKDVGYKGGASEAYMGAHPYYYEPTVTAVTDIVVPATRIQWGPVLAGLMIAVAFTFLMTGLGIALNLSATGMGYWIVGFGALGLFLGSMFASRTAKVGIWPAVMHAVVIWSILLIANTLVLGSVGAGVLGAIMARSGGAAIAAPGGDVSNYGWWYFGGFLILLAASILGALSGIHPEAHDDAVAPGQPESTTRP